jgi:hypothetical protein
MSKMGSHDPFGHLKHKLWPKERPWIKLVVWLPTIKSWESTWFLSVLVACNIPLKRSRQRLQLFFRLHCNRRVAHKVMRPQSCGSPNAENFGTPGTKCICMWSMWRGVDYTIRGKVVISPKLGLWWVLWVRVCSWLVLAPKVPKLCINQLIVWFVQIHVSDWTLVICLSPILKF